MGVGERGVEAVRDGADDKSVSPPRSCHRNRNGASAGAFGRPLFQLLKQTKKENIYLQHTYPCSDGSSRFLHFYERIVEGPKQPKNDTSDPFLHATMFSILQQDRLMSGFCGISSCSLNNTWISVLTQPILSVS